MTSLCVLVFGLFVASCSAGGPSNVVVNSGKGDPVCDVSEQVDFQVCMTDCFGEIPDAYSADAKDDEDVLNFLSCLSHCHLDPIGQLSPPIPRPAPGTPGPLDDSLKYLICYNRCYKDWADGTLAAGPSSCFKNEYLQLTLCFYTCVRGEYESVMKESQPLVVGKRSVSSLRRSKRAADGYMLMKARYVLCYLNCYEKDGSHDILQASGFTSTKTCEARDTASAAFCNAKCYDRAVNPRGIRDKRATDFAATKDRLLTVDCVARCLKVKSEDCRFDRILALQVCVDQCIVKKYAALDVAA